MALTNPDFGALLRSNSPQGPRRPAGVTLDDVDPADAVRPLIPGIRAQSTMLGAAAGAAVGGLAFSYLAMGLLSTGLSAGLHGLGTAAGASISTGPWSLISVPATLIGGKVFGVPEMVKNVAELGTKGLAYGAAGLTLSGAAIGAVGGGTVLTNVLVAREENRLIAKDAQRKRKARQQKVEAREDGLYEAMMKSKAQARRIGLPDQTDAFIGHGLAAAGPAPTALAEGMTA